jgi:hypothetical protein
MDNVRPSLDLKHFDDICPDKNGMTQHSLITLGLTCEILQVPVIAIFTKYDQFRREIKMKLEDEQGDAADLDAEAEAENVFNERYLANLRGSPSFICLESKGFVNQLARTPTLIDVLQECTSLASVVRILLKRLPIHSLVASLRSCF